MSDEEPESSDQHLVCPLCLDIFKEPRLLDCGHTFCLQCLQKNGRFLQHQDSIDCPVCREASKTVWRSGREASSKWVSCFSCGWIFRRIWTNKRLIVKPRHAWHMTSPNKSSALTVQNSSATRVLTQIMMGTRWMIGIFLKQAFSKGLLI